MTLQNPTAARPGDPHAPDPHPSDPFGERSPGRLHRSVQVLGGHFEFRSDSPALLDLVDAAYAGLPAHFLPGGTPRFQVELRLTDAPQLAGVALPPEARMQGGAGFFGALTDGANLALAFPEARRGLVAISRELLRFPYHARYELLEFVVFTLASRAQQLVPLHAGCVGWHGAGALLVGESGAGKSTVALHCLQQGGDLLTEDAAFVQPDSLLATGVANFLHWRFDALDFLDDGALKDRVARSPVIHRRSGVAKYEIDLRLPALTPALAPVPDPLALSPAPLALQQLIFVSREPAGAHGLLTALDSADAVARLVRTQGYAAHQPGWDAFIARAARLPAHELRRGRHPREAALAVQALMQHRPLRS